MRTKINKELLQLLPNEVKEMNLPPKAQEIYCNFISMSDKEGMCYSTIGGLAKALNCSKTTVMSNLKLLENKNLIIERVNGKRGVATRFKIKLFDGNSNENVSNGNENVSNGNENVSNGNENVSNGNENVSNGNSLNRDENELNCNLSNENYDTNSTNDNTDNNTELKKFIEEFITLKMNELKNDIILELRSLFNNDNNNNDTNEFFNDGHIKENKRKEKNIKQNNNNSYININNNIQEVNNKDIYNNLDNIENIEINKKDNKDIDLNINESIDKITCKYRKRKKNDYQYTVEEKDDYNPIVEETKVESILSKSHETTQKTKKFFYSLKDSTLTFSSWLEAQEYASKNDLNFDECFKKVEVLV